MCAGAFAMAAGEYVSVRSQRELFEYQIGLERDELRAVPGGRGAGTRADLRGEGPAARRRRRGSRTRLVADPEHALDTLAREELGLNPDELGSPWGAAISSFVSFAAGALLPLVPFVFARRPARAADRDRRHRGRAVRRRRDAVAVHRPQRARLGRADAGAGRARRRSHLRDRQARRCHAWLIAAAEAGAARSSPGARSRCGSGIPGSSPARSPRRRRRRRPATPSRSSRADGALARAAPRTRRTSQIRARVWTFDPARGDRRGVLRTAASRAAVARARGDARRRATPAAGSSTASPTGCPA